MPKLESPICGQSEKGRPVEGASTPVDWPSVTIAIPTFNSSNRITRCLNSIFNQDYPGETQVVIVDGGSNDQTLSKAERFPVKVLKTTLKNPEKAKLAAFENSDGNIFFYLDDDNELTRSDWIRQMVRPIVEDPSIVGSFTHHTATKEDSAVTRYLSYDKTQRDPFLAYFSIGIEDTFVEKKEGYILCRFTADSIPPVGLVLYRRSSIEEILKSIPLNQNRAFDIDLTAAFATSGFEKFAYVPVGIRHSHANDMMTLIRKRIIHVKRGFLLTYPNRKFEWLSLNNRSSLAKMVRWLVISNLILPLTISGFRKYYKYKDSVLLMEPLIGLVLTDAAVYAFLSDSRGRKIIASSFSALFGNRLVPISTLDNNP